MKNKRLYNRRKRRNGFFLSLSVLAAAFGLLWLGLILTSLFYNGFAGVSGKLFTQMTPPPGSDGGLANAILGSVVMSALAVAAGTPIGLLAGTYLAEYGRYARLSFFVRFINDILLSAPSIVTGLFIYEIIVVNMHGFSAWAGAASLTVIVIPVVVRTTENMLLLVPNGLREAAVARGARRDPHWRASGSRPHFGRDRASALYRAQ
jgi:phosphate transport system permease protein